MRGLVKKRVMERGGEQLHMMAQERVRGKGYPVFEPAGTAIPSILEEGRE